VYGVSTNVLFAQNAMGSRTRSDNLLFFFKFISHKSRNIFTRCGLLRSSVLLVFALARERVRTIFAFLLLEHKDS
jgi:hypothetical protein